MPRIYLIIVLLLTEVVGLFGFLAPFLVSHKSNELVIAGVVLVVFGILAMYYTVVLLIKAITKFNKRNEED